MPQDQEPTEGAYQHRENKRKELNARQGRLKTVRRALMYTGGGLLALILAKGALSGPVQPSTLEQNPNRPAPTETINPEIYSQLLERHPDAQAFLGGRIEISLGKTDAGQIIPRIRTEPEISQEYDAFPNSLLPSDIKLINGQPYDASSSNYFTIENYSTVLGENADEDPISNLNAPLRQNWLAMEVTKTDGSDILAYISLSDQTSEYWNVDKSGDPTALKSIIGTESINTLNKTYKPKP